MIPGAYRNLVLIGFMGAGKTSAGRTLAERLGWDFVDADAEIELVAGTTIADVFAMEGEAAFRELEERVVEEHLQRVDCVIALGGGAIMSPLTRERLRDGSFTVLLDVTAQTAWRRVEAEAGERPLAREGRAFSRLYKQRQPLYHATADALCDAEYEVGEEPLLVPLARPAALAELPRLVGVRRPALIADRNVLRVVGLPVEPFVTVRLPPGEAAKTPTVARQAWTRLADLGLERGDVVVGYGGGAATDLAGFVAATYQRGVPWIAAPTTLVGMVDAAIGGKTGIDLPSAKNYVGAFHRPEWVVTDPAVLDTLPVREWACGFAEVIKTGLLAGGRLWDLVKDWEPGRGTADQRLELIRRCAAYKAHVVADDPREQGLRAVLNLGHTIGHAFEAAAGYKGLAHGEAVAVGLLPALWLSSQITGLDQGVEADVRELLTLHELPTSYSQVGLEDVLAMLQRDKKARGGRPRFVLLEAIGKPVWGIDPGDDLIEQAIARALNAS